MIDLSKYTDEQLYHIYCTHSSLKIREAAFGEMLLRSELEEAREIPDFGHYKPVECFA